MILAVDFGSGGVTAAALDRDLGVRSLAEEELTGATLSGEGAIEALVSALRQASAGVTPDALVLSSMMHTLLITDTANTPLTPVSTWMDREDFSGADSVRNALGADYTERTGCWFHPSFPLYRWPRLMSDGELEGGGDFRLHSLRSWMQQALTGVWSEDIGSASASGLLNLRSGTWDARTLEAVGVDSRSLPPLVACPTIIGTLHADMARRCRLSPELPVVAGSGDGFLAALGSGCDRPDRIAITLGTSSAVRWFQTHPRDTTETGMFCYRYAEDRFLVGSASSNGGNALDWARKEFGRGDPARATDPPLFLPWAQGERAPFWDSTLEPRWLGVSEAHTPGDLHRSVREAVVFTMAAYSRGAGHTAKTRGILSGNGFRDVALARMLARVAPFPVLLPKDPGMATLRGAARVAFEAIDGDGAGTQPAAEALVRKAAPVEPAADAGLETRFSWFIDCLPESYASSKSEA